MTQTIINRLEKAGIKPEEIAVRVNVIALLGDIQESLAVELDSILKKAHLATSSLDRLDVAEIRMRAKRLRKPVDTLLSEQTQIGFGAKADELREVIFSYLKND